MACFVVSTVTGVGVTVARHVVKHHEKKKELAGEAPKIEKFGSDTKWSKKLAYLELMLFAGSFILAIEHIIHGEIVPYPPFFSAIGEGGTIEMLKEMGTVGVAMLGILLVTWVVGVLVVDYIKFKKRKSAPEAKKEGAK
ncbi:MAG: hypothetical protein IJQ72_06070 [Bacilli bacterium]|nr:hypothetical protein [Bacilli bacterium]